MKKPLRNRVYVVIGMLVLAISTIRASNPPVYIPVGPKELYRGTIQGFGSTYEAAEEEFIDDLKAAAFTCGAQPGSFALIGVQRVRTMAEGTFFISQDFICDPVK